MLKVEVRFKLRSNIDELGLELAPRLTTASTGGLLPRTLSILIKCVYPLLIIP